MWGNYAENHKGICIIYDLDQSKEFRIKIKDNDFQTLKPKKVDYGGETIERNFFETLGRMPIPQIIRFLTGKDGVVSNCYKVYQTEDVWRSAYWDAFEAKNYRKLDAWSYEKEYRINLTDMFYEFGDISSRDLEYDPSILKGVIFGIKTPEYYKRKVYDALFNKRHIFKEVTFYQAVFDEEEQNIKIRKKEGWEL